MSLLSSTTGFFVAIAYKTYGFFHIKDDHFLTKVGAVASIFNGLARIFWG